jgi:hypothetical protein
LGRRQRWETENIRVAICVDYDDAQAAAIRAGLPFDEMLTRLASHGATHVSLPEWTLNRLLGLGLLAPQAPTERLPAPPAVGHWNYLSGPADLIGNLVRELAARLPYTEARALDGQRLAFAGDLPTIGEIGLGFDREMAASVRAHGLHVVPRPVSYAWPEKALLERTLAQAGELGRLVAFDGAMILGHEMHLDETLAAMEDSALTLVYFAESRHQKGDWFIAKRRAPHVVLGHRFTPDEMVPLDFHAAAHNWAHLARERGIRFFYVNFFRVLHATEPLEGLTYLEHLSLTLNEAGFQVAAEVKPPTPVPGPAAEELAVVGLGTAGLAAAAVNNLFDLPESLALPLTVAGAAGAAALPMVEASRLRAFQTRAHHHPHEHIHDHEHDHDHGHEYEHEHEHTHDHGDLQVLYPPSYAPKLLALGTATLAPIAALARDDDRAWTAEAAALFQGPAAAAILAAVTSGREYHLRIEEYRSFNLDWLLPLAAAGMRLPQRPIRLGLLLGLFAAWLAAQRRGLDPLAAVDPGHALGHTHHISGAQRLVGDVKIALGLRPARKWAGLGPAGVLAGRWLVRRDRPELAALAMLAGTFGHVLGLVGFRRPERALEATLPDAAPSFALGAALGLATLLDKG